MDGLETLFGVLGGMIVVVIAIVIVCYILTALGMQHVLKKLGFAYPWLAWIPVGNMIALGLSIAEENGKSRVLGKDMPNFALAIYFVIAWVVGYIPAIGSFLSLAVTIIGAGTIYSYVYSRMEDRQLSESYLLGYLSSVIGIIPMIKFLIYRSRDKKSEIEM